MSENTQIDRKSLETPSIVGTPVTADGEKVGTIIGARMGPEVAKIIAAAIKEETRRLESEALTAESFQVICPKHGRSKIFKNKIFAEQELARHKTETLPMGHEARLVFGSAISK